MASSTKWRLHIDGNNGGSDLQITEIEMHTSIGGADVCTGGTATAISEYSGTYAASKAFDDSASTRWLPAVGTGKAENWIQYEFASAVEIVEYTIDALSASNQPTLAPRFWWLEYWDGSAWIPADFRYEQGSWGATETRVFACDAASPPLNLCNLLGTISASTEYSAFYVARNAFQGDYGGYPWAASTNTGWLEYDFGTGVEYAISGYRLQARTDTSVDQSPKSWTLQYYDGATWQTVDTQTSVSAWSLGEWRAYSFSNIVGAQRWRINVTENQGNSFLAIRSLQLFGGVPMPVAQPGAATPAITTQAPTINQGTTAVMVPGVASAVLTTSAPEADITTLLLPGSVAATIAPASPAVSATANAYPSPAAYPLAVTPELPTSLVTEITIITPGASALALSTSAPTAWLGRAVTPGAASSAINGSEPTLRRDYVCSPAVVGLEILELVPGQIISVSLAEAPGPGAVVVSGAVPSAAVGEFRSPGGAVLVLGRYPPALRHDLVASPAHDGLSIQGAAPALQLATNVVRLTNAQYARPDADFSVSWVPVGSPTLWGAIDEAHPDDADYMYGTGIQIVGLSDIADPGFDTGFTIRCRAWCPTGSGWLSYTLIQGAIEIGGGSIVAGIPATPIDIAFALTPAQVSAITDFGDLRIKFWQLISGPVYVGWAALEIVGVTTKLGVSASAPSVLVADTQEVPAGELGIGVAQPALGLGMPVPNASVVIGGSTPTAAIGGGAATGGAQLVIATYGPSVEVQTRLNIIGYPPYIDHGVGGSMSGAVAVRPSVGASHAAEVALQAGVIVSSEM